MLNLQLCVLNIGVKIKQIYNSSFTIEVCKNLIGKTEKENINVMGCIVLMSWVHSWIDEMLCKVSFKLQVA